MVGVECVRVCGQSALYFLFLLNPFCSIAIVGLMKMLTKRSLNYNKAPRAKNKTKEIKGTRKDWMGWVDGSEERKEKKCRNPSHGLRWRKGLGENGHAAEGERRVRRCEETLPKRIEFIP